MTDRFYAVVTIGNIGFGHDDRPVGVFPDLKTACEVIETNNCDIHENYYTYVVVEAYDWGLYPDCRKVVWYKWNLYEKRYIVCDEPTEEKLYTNYAIG